MGLPVQCTSFPEANPKVCCQRTKTYMYLHITISPQGMAVAGLDHAPTEVIQGKWYYFSISSFLHNIPSGWQLEWPHGHGEAQGRK